MNKKLLLLLVLAAGFLTGQAQFRTNAQQQILTNEDSLTAGSNKSKTVLSGYGSAFYQRNNDLRQATASLERVVLFVGHKFNDKIAFFSELELENALVSGADSKGEISMEQAFLKFNFNPKQYLLAGLFIPRIGILNENHLPVNFNGVERPLVEQLVIPATWRELGVAFYGSLNNMPLNYSLALMNGLNSQNLEHGDGIRGGRPEGSSAFANNLAVSAALQYMWKDFKFQVSGYMGGTVGLSKRSADSLNLNSGAFGTPVYLGEADVQYSKNGVSGKLLGAYIAYPDAAKVNTAYAKNIANGMYGAYAELGYDWLYRKKQQPQFITFARFEVIDLNASVPAPPKAIYDGTEKQNNIIAGFSYLPIPNVVIKADVRILHTGPQNSALVINPAPNALPYNQNNSFINVGIGYSF
ncbi:MAG: porin [Chitinophagaceae bacterium]